MQSVTITCLRLLALCFVLAGLFSVPASAESAREVSVVVDPGLFGTGVRATVASVPPASAQDPGAPAALVFVTYEKAFHGELYVRGFRKDGTEIARSAAVKTSENAEAGGHVRFTFDKDTKLAEVSSFILEGGLTPIPPAPPKKESIGEEAKSIVKELLQAP